MYLINIETWHDDETTEVRPIRSIGKYVLD